MILRDRLRQAVDRLQSAGVDGAGRDARILLSHVHNISLDRLTLHLGDADDWGVAQENHFFDCLQQRAQGRPVAKIVGRKAFWKDDFWVTDDVLDPRPETEVLVAAALEHDFQNILDIGTGSGAIVLSLLNERPQAEGIATDISNEAVQVAQENARRLGVADRVRFEVSNVFDGVPQGQFDLIVSNPPYVTMAEMADLSKDTLFDPQGALTDGADGLSFYRQLAKITPAALTQNAVLLVEIGPTQGNQVRALFKDAGFEDLRVLQDLDGRDRVVGGYWRKCGKLS